MLTKLSDDELLFRMALTAVWQMGDVQISTLLKYFETAERVFSAQRRELECIPGIGAVRASAIKSFKQFSGIAREIEHCRSTGTQILVRGHEGYPARLEHCPDAPSIMFFSGNHPPELPKVISIVGTRSPTSYGKERVVELVEVLGGFKVLVVSGLAYGVDTIVHRESLKKGLATIGVLGHGLDKLYPYANRQLAEDMKQNGGLLTEFMRGTKPDRQNFPRRNRIVAGMSDAIVVVESGLKGGSLITAELGNDYNRDVLAYPGRSIDEQSMGCNSLIAASKANLVTCGEDVVSFLNWSVKQHKQEPMQMKLFDQLSEEEQQAVNIIATHQPISIDKLVQLLSGNAGKIASLLLSLEMKGILALLPGKLYAVSRS
jgi:DNA processing protein